MIGENVTHYRILEKVGEGGMGEVYVAEDTRLGRQVALKFLPSTFSRDLIAVERFRREARAASALNHPNICTVYDIGEHDGRPFIAMELLEGMPLRDSIALNKISIPQMIELALQLADALDAAHAKGIAHRDIKPANIYITGRGQAKILDFGLAKVRGQPTGEDPKSWIDSRTTDSISLTTPGSAIGTVAYMSPEQARGDDTDARTDMFSLGSVFYEMATRRQPFTGKTSAVVYDAILNRDPAPAAEINPEVPPELQRIIQKLLEKDPDLRYQTAAELRADLKRLRRDSDSGRSGSGARVAAPARPSSRRWLGIAAVVAVLATVGVLALLRNSLPIAPGDVNIRSLAVLPLENLSGDPDQEYLADGLTEALIGDLAQLPGLRVVSRTSVMQYKQKPKALREIARELDVDAVVQGSVMRSGDRIRVSAQLLLAATDRHLWAQTYDRQFSDILALQSDVAQAIASQVRLNLTAQARQRLERRGPVNTDAHEAFLRGRRALQRFTPESIRHGLEYFQRATELEPKFAAAYSGVADAHTALGVLNMVAPGQAFPEALAAAEKAVALDPTLSDAHVSRGYAQFLYGWKFSEAEQSFRRALELNPNNPEARRGFSLYLAAMGRRREAVAEAEHAVSLDPLSPYFHTNLIFVLMLAGQLDDAVAAGQKTIALDPAHPGAHLILGVALEARGRYDEAIAEFQKAADLSPLARADLSRVRSLALSGKKDEARRELNLFLQQTRGEGGYSVSIAQTFAALGERDKAFAYLARAEEQRQGSLVFLRAHPRFAELRDDTRLEELASRLGLPANPADH